MMAEWKLPRRKDGFEVRWSAPVRTLAEAARFVDHVGFCVLFPVKNVPLPSLYFAVSRRQEARWDKHAQLIWKWKDELPGRRRAFYAKYFRDRGTFLSPGCLSLLLAAHETAVAPESAEDFYTAGRISRDACDLWIALAKHGPLATLELRHACKLETLTGNKRFKKAIVELQRQLVVTHSGAEQETDAWASNRFDLVSRVFPSECHAAAEISPEAARKALAARYQALYPLASAAVIARLFGWTKAQATSALSL